MLISPLNFRKYHHKNKIIWPHWRIQVNLPSPVRIRHCIFFFHFKKEPITENDLNAICLIPCITGHDVNRYTYLVL